MRSRSHRSPLPGFGRDGSRGRGAGWPLRWQHQRGRRPSPTFLTAYGWWLRAQVSRDPPPPLPGGYKLDEKVFFTGPSQTLPSGNKVVHGQQGEVVGSATNESVEGKGVDVLFPGNKGNTSCLLTQVRRLRAASAAHPPACAPHTRRCPRP